MLRTALRQSQDHERIQPAEREQSWARCLSLGYGGLASTVLVNMLELSSQAHTEVPKLRACHIEFLVLRWGRVSQRDCRNSLDLALYLALEDFSRSISGILLQISAQFVAKC